MVAELLAAALAVAGGGVFAARLIEARQERAAERARRDEDAQTIAMGDALGIEYVPGENIDLYREKVIAERDRLVRRAQRGRP